MMTNLKKRNIVVMLFLSLFTCAIYPIIWYFTAISEMNDEMKRIFPAEDTISPVKAFLLSLISCGIYGVYAYYTWAKNIEKLGTYYQVSTTEPVITIIFALFLPVVAQLLLQSDMNKMVEKVENYQQQQNIQNMQSF